MRLRSLLLFVLASGMAFAGAIDGTWVGNVKMRAGKKAGGGDRLVEVRLNLKSDGDKATGSVSSGGKRGSTLQIADGKIDGNHVSFTTTQTTKKGSQKQVWDVTVDGDTIHGTRSREGAKRGQDFTAKRS